METSASLLDRLRHSGQPEDWQQLLDIYTPLIRNWLRRYSASEQDAEDVVQEVLAVVVRKLPLFERERIGSFRSWLRTISVNCLRDSWRRDRFRPNAAGGSDFRMVLEQWEDPGSELSQLWNEQHDQHVLQALLEQIRPNINDTTWQAFRRTAMDNEPATEVAADLGLTVNQVYIARSRTMARLREIGQGLIE